MEDRPTVDVSKTMSYAAIAKALGRSRQVVWSWFQENRRIPAESVLSVEHVTGIPRHKLRPDLYERPRVAESATEATQ